MESCKIRTILIAIFAVIYAAFFGIFTSIDFFKKDNCNGNKDTNDYEKIAGYAFYPAFGLTLIVFIYISPQLRSAFVIG